MVTLKFFFIFIHNVLPSIALLIFVRSHTRTNIVCAWTRDDPRVVIFIVLPLQFTLACSSVHCCMRKKKCQPAVSILCNCTFHVQAAATTSTTNGTPVCKLWQYQTIAPCIVQLFILVYSLCTMECLLGERFIQG